MRSTGEIREETTREGRKGGREGRREGGKRGRETYLAFRRIGVYG